MGALIARAGNAKAAARVSGFTSRSFERWKTGRASPRPSSLEVLRRALVGGVEGDPPEEREARLVVYEQRVAAGRCPWKGEPVAPARAVAELLMASGLGADRDLLECARFLDQREAERERAAQERERRGLEPEEDQEDEEQGSAPGALLRLLEGRGEAG